MSTIFLAIMMSQEDGAKYQANGNVITSIAAQTIQKAKSGVYTKPLILSCFNK